MAEEKHPKQYHLDFEVDLIEAKQRRVIELGATLRKDFIGPEGYGWQLCTDPVGHPFCLCRHKEVSWIDKRVAWPPQLRPRTWCSIHLLSSVASRCETATA